MKQNALLCGNKTPFVNSVASKLEAMDWNAGQVSLSSRYAGDLKKYLDKTGAPDMLIFFTGKNKISDKSKIRDGLNYDQMIKIYEQNTVMFLRIVEVLHQPMLKSQLKRICLVTDSAGSINQNRSTDGYGYSMSLAALNSLMYMLANLMRPQGFTFRLLCADGAEKIPDAANNAVAYLLRDRAYMPRHKDQGDENRLVLRDLSGREIPF